MLRLQLWRSSKCVLALESVSREDTDHHESEQQLKELLQVSVSGAQISVSLSSCS